MCTVGKVMACEISFLPLGASDTSDLVKKVIENIKESGLEYKMGDMSTLVKGKRDILFQLLKDIYVDMEEECEFVLLVKMSNTCGC